jgi:hypothetical protein
MQVDLKRKPVSILHSLPALLTIGRTGHFKNTKYFLNRAFLEAIDQEPHLIGELT